MTASSPGTRRLLLRFLPYAAASFVLLSFVLFFRSSLNRYTNHFSSDFKAGNLVELNSGAVYQIAAQLNRISSSANILCIHASNNGTSFFERSSDRIETDAKCRPSPHAWLHPLLPIVRQARVDSDSGSLRIDFLLRLPMETEFLFAIFLCLFLGLVLVLHWSSRLLESLEHAERVALAQAEVERLKSQLIEETRRSSLGLIAAQVAHDIRSPLAALDVLLARMTAFAEDDRNLVRRAVDRIRDIANDLLEKAREAPLSRSRLDSDPRCLGHSAILLSSLIEPIVSEKRTQFRSRLGIAIETRLQPGSYGLFAQVDPRELKRLLSNLLNNAVEALDETGKVEVVLARGNDPAAEASIIVRDNGRGIPADALERIGNVGQTHGKPGGTGLGLFHAFTQVEGWGGRLEIHSQESRGTEVRVFLPIANVPAWFVPELKVKPDSRIVILDDDATIHSIWKDRLRESGVLAPEAQLLHLTQPDELRQWHLGPCAADRRTILLIDYEFLGNSVNGLQLVEELKFTDRAILVTSRFEDPVILAECERLGVRLIPKPLAGFVPIVSESADDLPSPIDAVLIEGDPLVHLTWEIAAQSAGRRYRPFVEPAEFFRQATCIPRDCPIYIDSHLRDGVRGDAVAARIAGLGFTRIYLATGDAPEEYAHLSFLQGIRSKNPPWSSPSANIHSQTCTHSSSRYTID